MNELPSSPTEGQIATSQGLRYRHLGGVWELIGTGMPGGCIDVQEFLTGGAGTWTKPANAELVIVELVGAGGGGAGGPGGTTGSTGGGGGAYARFVLHADELDATHAIWVPSGGTAGAYGANGANGGDAVFYRDAPYVDLVAQGGFGGPVGNGTARGGGYETSLVVLPLDYVNVWSGGSCDPGITPHSTMGAGAGAGGDGHSSTTLGASLFGTAGRGGLGGGQTSPTAGTAPGGGGGGGYGTQAGAAGAMGRVRVYTFGREA